MKEFKQEYPDAQSKLENFSQITNDHILLINNLIKYNWNSFYINGTNV